MNGAFGCDLHQFRVLFRSQGPRHFHFDLDSVEHAFFRFAFLAVRCIDARVRERNRNVFQRQTIPARVKSDCHRSAHAKRCEQIIVWIRSRIAAAHADRLVADEVMFTRNDFLLKISTAAVHDDMSCLFVGLCSHGLDQALRIPLKASRYRQRRKTNKIEMTAANGRPLGSIKI